MKERFGKLFSDDDIYSDFEPSRLEILGMCNGANLCVDVDEEDEIFIRQHHRYVIIDRIEMQQTFDWLKKNGVIK